MGCYRLCSNTITCALLMLFLIYSGISLRSPSVHMVLALHPRRTPRTLGPASLNHSLALSQDNFDFKSSIGAGPNDDKEDKKQEKPQTFIFPWLKLGEMITCYDPLTHRVLSASIIKTDGYSILVRYKNFAEIYNEWIDRDSPRIKSPSQGQKIMVVDGTALAKVLQKEQVTFYSWEVQIMQSEDTSGCRIGVAHGDFNAKDQLGEDNFGWSISYDSDAQLHYGNGAAKKIPGRKYIKEKFQNVVVGVFVDLKARTLEFSLNGNKIGIGEFSFDLNPQRRGTHIELPSRTSFRLRQGTNTKIQKYDVVQGSVLGDRSLDMKGVQFYYWEVRITSQHFDRDFCYVGVATRFCDVNTYPGNNLCSWAYESRATYKISPLKQNIKGDVIGVWVDVIHRKMHFSLNGKVQKKVLSYHASRRHKLYPVVGGASKRGRGCSGTLQNFRINTSWK